MPLISKPNYNQIFASQAPEQDKPAVFNNYPLGWGVESRPNNGKPTIKGFNYLQQTSDLKDLWILQNGACLPYDESIEYADGAPVLKDGVIQYKTASGFSPAISDKPYILSYFTDGAIYPLNARVMLENGDIVKSTIANNATNPNTDMTGWKKDGDGASATPSILTGATNTPNVTEFYQWNKITTAAAASKADAGTNQQPNLIGWSVNLSEQAADGTTYVFTVANSFPVVLDPAKEIVRVALIRLSDGVRFPQVTGTHYSINVAGDNTVTINFNTAPQNIYSVWIRVIGSTQNSNSPLLNFITNGYDNVTDGAGPMLEMTGAHHTELNNPSGHNTYAGGSYNQIINGCSYSLVGGHENHLEGVAFGFVLGGRNTLKASSGAAVFGQNSKIYNSTGVLSGGYDHNFDGKPYTIVGGRGAIPIASGGISIGNNKSGDIRAGLRQFDIFGLSKTTTDATEGFLSQNSGTSLNILNVTSAAFVTAEVIATSSDGSDQKTFSVKFCAKRVGGVVTLIGTPIIVDDFTTVNASTWSLRIQATSNGFYIRPTGEAGKTIRWMASVRVTSSAFDAA